jgi:hypothetical protein
LNKSEELTIARVKYIVKVQNDGIWSNITATPGIPVASLRDDLSVWWCSSESQRLFIYPFRGLNFSLTDFEKPVLYIHRGGRICHGHTLVYSTFE